MVFPVSNKESQIAQNIYLRPCPLSFQWLSSESSCVTVSTGKKAEKHYSSSEGQGCSAVCFLAPNWCLALILQLHVLVGQFFFSGFSLNTFLLGLGAVLSFSLLKKKKKTFNIVSENVKNVSILL